MPMTREARRAYDAARRRSSASRNGARARARQAHQVRFLGVDGEGITRPDGAHDYNLLSIGGESTYHRDGRALSFDDVAQFIWEQRDEDPDAVMVGFFLGYDFAQWLRRVPEEQARLLLTDEGRALRQRSRSGGNPYPFPVRWGPWEFDILPNMRRFKLRPTHVQTGYCLACGDACNGDPKAKSPHPWAYICDVGPFFQSSLLTAVNPAKWPEPVLTSDEYAQLQAGKAARRGPVVPYGTPVDPTTIAYNRLENDVLARVMDRYNTGLVAMGVSLTRTQWHGPGQAAQAWMRQEAPDHTGDNWRQLSDWDRQPYDAAMASYFGGWFEIPAHGPIPGTSWDYDINSAYPHIIAQLPCLRPGHGTWHWGEGNPTRRHTGLTAYRFRKERRYRLLRASVRGSNPYLGAMLHRHPSGRVLRPHGTAGWYWAEEVEAAKRAGLIDQVTVHEWWQYVPSCNCPSPFRTVAQLYRQRLQVGKNAPQGRALRLVYNSAYGKMAQSVGQPMFSNPVYASLITSGCRTMILDAIATHPVGPRAVLMVATDGVYFTSRHPGLDIDPERLGAWDETPLEDLSLLKPGVYWHAGTERAIIKSRGVSEEALGKVLRRLDAQWKRRSATQLPAKAADRNWWPATTVTIPFSVLSPRQALQRDRWELCGAIAENTPNTQSAWPGAKRAPEPPPDTPDDGFYRTRPWGDMGDSTPYDKRFGIELREWGWDTEVITPEGDVATIWADLLRDPV